MPNEVGRILLPYHENNIELLPFIDKTIREKKNISDLLEITNKKILHDNFGFSNADIDLVNNIWKKLSKRRLNRGKK